MNLNGGYIMLDLDDTSNLLDRVKEVYDSGKPLVVKYGDRLQFANFAKRASSNSNFDITLSDNTKLDIHYYSGALTESVVVSTIKYRHLIAFTVSQGSNTYKVVLDIVNTNSSKITSVPNAIKALKDAGYDSLDTVTLCAFGDGYAQVYATLQGTSTYQLWFKINGVAPFYTATTGTFASDNVYNV